MIGKIKGLRKAINFLKILITKLFLNIFLFLFLNNLNLDFKLGLKFNNNGIIYFTFDFFNLFNDNLNFKFVLKSYISDNIISSKKKKNFLLRNFFYNF